MKILDGSNPSNMLLVSKDVIDTHNFDSESNVYDTSDIKDWIENSFVSRAQLQDKFLNSDSKYNEKVFLLGIEDYSNISYGFDTTLESSSTRQSLATEYAIGNGNDVLTNGLLEYGGNTHYWIRDAYPGVTDSAYYIGHDGGFYFGPYIAYSLVGVRPALRFNSDNNAYNIAHGIIPTYDSATNTVTFGQYPQTVVTDSTVLTALAGITANSKGYKCYNGENYVCVESANPFAGATFDNGTSIGADSTYYFKVESIKWRVLSIDDSIFTLVSDKILDVHAFDSRMDTGTQLETAKNNYNGTDQSTSTDNVYANNYKYSDIRKWLNETFIENINVSPNKILTTEVKNDASTTDNVSNTFVCSDTNDKVYLLSFEDYANTNYFSNDAARYCQPSDFAKANCARISDNSSYEGNGYYWTRSPKDIDSTSVSVVNKSGDLDRSSCYSVNIGVRPSLCITIPND